MLLKSIAALTCSFVFAAPLLAADEAPKVEPKKPARANAERANRGYPPKLDGAEEQVYKTIGDVKLNAYIYKPADWKASDQRPAIVFFFGGGWTSGVRRRIKRSIEGVDFVGHGPTVSFASESRPSCNHERWRESSVKR